MNRIRLAVIFFCIGCAVLVINSCGDIFSSASSKDTVNAKNVSGLVSVAGDSSIALTWTLPVFEGFAKVVLLRKTNTYPLSYSDPAAAKVYEGTDASYTDTSTTAGNLYCYSLYSVNTKGLFCDQPAMTKKSLVSGFTATVRKRCFYLVGGSSDSDDPFTNLVSEVDAFDPETDTVYPNIATLPVPRYSCAVASANGKIFVFGGLDSKMKLVAQVDVLDVCSSTWPEEAWTKAPDMPFPRYSLRAENVDDRIFVFGGSTRLSPWPWASMTDYNHKLDPYTCAWNINESQVPKLQPSSFMNFASGAFSGHIVYGTGRYNANYTFVQNVYTLNLDGNFYYNANDADVGARASAAGVMYHKPIAGDVDLVAFFIIGGCNNTNTYFEPLKSTTGTPLTAIATCCYEKMPVTAADPVIPMTGKNINTARAYAEAEAYVDSGNNGFIYLFCGRQNLSTAVLSSYEVISVDDALTFPTGWTEVTSTNLNERFAFDITKVNF